MGSDHDCLPDCFSPDFPATSVPSPTPSRLLSLAYLAPITWALCCSLRGTHVSGPLHLLFLLCGTLLALACSCMLALAQCSLLFKRPWITPAFTMIVRPPPLPIYSLWNVKLSVLHVFFPQNGDRSYPQRAGVGDTMRYPLLGPQITAEI